MREIDSALRVIRDAETGAVVDIDGVEVVGNFVVGTKVVGEFDGNEVDGDEVGSVVVFVQNT